MSVSKHWLAQVAATVSKRYGVKLHKGREWSADVKKQIITYPDRIRHLTADETLGLLLHEIAHIKYTAPLDDKKKYPLLNDFANLTRSAVNMVEDKRIERKIGKQFPGGAQALQIVGETLTESLRKEMMHYSEKMDVTKEMARVASNLDTGITLPREQMLAIATNNKLPFTEEALMVAALEYVGKKLPEYYWNKDALKLGRQFAQKMREHNVEEMESVDDVYKFFEREIFPELQPYVLPEPPKQGSNGSGDDQSDPYGKGTNSIECSPDRNGNRNTMKNSCGHGKGNHKEYDHDDEPNPIDDHINELIDELVEKRTGKKPSRDTHRLGRVNIYTYEYGKLIYKELIDSMRNSFARILQDNKAKRFEGRYRTGRLNLRRLAHHRGGDMRLFQRQEVDNDKSYAFSIAIDESGSMINSRIQKSVDAAIVVLEVLKGIGAPVALWTFNTHARQVKKHETEMTPAQFDKGIRDYPGGGTFVANVLAKALPELSQVPTDVHIMILLTDGEMTSQDIDECQALLKRHKNILFYPIGINTHRLDTSFIGHEVVQLQDVDQILEAFVAILKKHMRKVQH